jgi:hypothetical protein
MNSSDSRNCTTAFCASRFAGVTACVYVRRGPMKLVAGPLNDALTIPYASRPGTMLAGVGPVSF